MMFLPLPRASLFFMAGLYGWSLWLVIMAGLYGWANIWRADSSCHVNDAGRNCFITSSVAMVDSDKLTFVINNLAGGLPLDIESSLAGASRNFLFGITGFCEMVPAIFVRSGDECPP
jgi:hypothetical protein